MTFDYEKFCKRLKILRKMTGYNKYQMSIQSNIHYQYYCNIENGNRVPNFKIIISIANALKVDLACLLDTDDNEKNILINSIEDKLSSVADNSSLLEKFNDVLLAIKNQTEVKNEGL